MGGQCPGAPELRGPRETERKKKKRKFRKEKIKEKKKERNEQRKKTTQKVSRHDISPYISLVVDRKLDPTEGPIPKSKIGNQHKTFEI